MDSQTTTILGGKGFEGKNLLGRFFLEQQLGEGGYGEVYLATQLSVKRRCAVKILSQKTGDPKFLKRFEVEARATSKLTHPHTIIVYDFGTDGDIAFIAMEFLDGVSLMEKLGNSSTMNIAKTLHLAHQIAQSLDDAHQHGLIHRDIKPHNIMVINRGKDPLFVKVIDFGLVKAIRGDEPIQATLTRLTRTGAVVGTPAYMSPEQVSDSDLDGKSDQYSLAVLVYRSLCGRTPFIGKNPVDLAAKHLLNKALPMRTYMPTLKVSDAFEACLARALSKKPEDRFPTCQAFIDALLEESSYDSIEAVSSEVTMKLGAAEIASSIDSKRTAQNTPKIAESLMRTTEPSLPFADNQIIAPPNKDRAAWHLKSANSGKLEKNASDRSGQESEKKVSFEIDMGKERHSKTSDNSKKGYFILFVFLFLLCSAIAFYFFSR